MNNIVTVAQISQTVIRYSVAAAFVGAAAFSAWATLLINLLIVANIAERRTEMFDLLKDPAVVGVATIDIAVVVVLVAIVQSIWSHVRRVKS